MTMSIRAVVLGAVLALLAAMPAAAQDLSLGYQWQRLSGGGQSETLPLGFNVDVSVPISGPLSVVGQFDWSRKSESASAEGVDASGSVTLSTFGGGVRWNGTSSGGAVPFVQALIGASRGKFSFSCEIAGVDFCDGSDENTSDTMVEFGGGVALPFGGKTSFVGQVDFRRLFGNGEGTNSFRLVGGVRIKL